MITWMQKKKKYLIVTIWVSTIAFVGAGFVGWGQYSYGDKASAVAKVGSVDISMGEFQKNYSNLYAQYNQMFGGEFDKEKAKAFGLQSQALELLINQALVLNLAKYYDIEVSDEEVAKDITSRDYFHVDGKFDKAGYEDILARNNINKKEYEQGIKKELIITKLLSLMDAKTNENEQGIIDFALGIADKIEYKVLDPKLAKVSVDDEKLHEFWEKSKNDFMSEPSYDVEYIEVPITKLSLSEDDIKAYYDENKESLKDDDGKLLTLDDAKDKIIMALSTKESKTQALKAYVAFKKGEDSTYEVKKVTISSSQNPFNDEILSDIAALKSSSDLLKPIEFNSKFYSFKKVSTNEAKPKSFEEAKQSAMAQYVEAEQRKQVALEATSSVSDFSGDVSDFVNHANASSLILLDDKEKGEFLNALMVSQKSKDFVTLSNGKMVLYKILEQKVLTNNNKEISVAELKSRLFNEGLVKILKQKYKTEIFLKEGI